jgi:dTDP-4-dehydrorhamnose 3,5-epimerase
MGGGMKLNATAIDGLYVAETEKRADHRGAFARLFCMNDLAAAVGGRQIVQINHSHTAAVGALRGLHFQHPPHAEMKMVRCLKGRVWDVAVDIRKNSPTYLQYHAVELTPDNARMMVIPEGFAHGFQVLAPESELLYLHTAFYHPAAEGGLRYDDPALAIDWPLPVSDISDRDKGHALIAEGFDGVVI